MRGLLKAGESMRNMGFMRVYAGRGQRAMLSICNHLTEWKKKSSAPLWILLSSWWVTPNNLKSTGT